MEARGQKLVFKREASAAFWDYLRKHGLRKTAQRELVLNAFLSTEGHVTAEDLYSRLRSRGRISYTTVYRTLKYLEASGVARVVELGDGVTRYEHDIGHEHHDHLVCTSCGKIIEVRSQRIEELQDKLVKAHKFQPETHRLQIFGLCDACRKKKRR
jgi:Fur family ferric uptake transcriptional regulator